MTNNKTYLYHHGIKGQKWGIRRYQNYDGTYTQRGVQRYKENVQIYNDLKQARKDLKKYGSTYLNTAKKGTVEMVATTKQEMREGQRLLKKSQDHYRDEANKAYKQLKYDRYADKGKELYKQGKRIGNSPLKAASSLTGTVASIAGGLAYVNNLLGGDPKLTKAAVTTAAVAGVGTATLAAGAAVVDYNRDKYIRAYYSH